MNEGDGYYFKETILWIATGQVILIWDQPPLGDAKTKKELKTILKKIVKKDGRNKGKLSGQVPHYK